MADISITAANVVAGANADTTNGICGETITAGQALYLASADGRWYKADNNSATEQVRIAKGIALNGGGAGQPVRVITKGLVTIGATLTAGVTYYLSDAPGGICVIADVGSGEYSCILGIATSTTVLDVLPHYSGASL